MALLQPSGLMALQERDLMMHATLFMLIVIVPVFAFTFFVAWHYRAGNTKALFVPNWEHAKMEELIWWAIPFEIVLVLGALTWTSTHTLDPHRALASASPPIVIEVVALQWKWLFIYPEEHIATVNYVQFPVGRPVEFHITADAPMNSFWIPELSGQIYAMSGMVTELHVVTDTPGSYRGASANYSGDGFAAMRFVARATSQEDFDVWVSGAREASSSVLSQDTYGRLALPSTSSAPELFGSIDENLYNSIVTKFTSGSSLGHMPTMH